ncbi:MAG: phage head-tail connector protein [Acutalibacteraceae bacterium]
MQKSKMLETLRSMTGEENESILLVYLDLAAGKIIEKLYPLEKGACEVPAKYHAKQVEIACYMLNKRGAEGQTSHSENGISRSYESADVPKSLLDGIVPHGKVLGV